MSILTSIMGKLGGNIIEQVGSVVDRFVQTPDERAEIRTKMAEILATETIEAERSIQERYKAVQGIIAAEMQHGNAYTKSARPTIVYAGLLMFLLQGILSVWGLTFTVNPEFVFTWGGVCGVWVMSRSYERKNPNGSAVSRAVTGTKAPTLEL